METKKRPSSPTAGEIELSGTTPSAVAGSPASTETTFPKLPSWTGEVREDTSPHDAAMASSTGEADNGDTTGEMR